MANIYEQHMAAFRHVSACVILLDGERVATIAFKFPKDRAGRLYAYVHWIGSGMVRGYAGGYGYDKRTAAASSAARRLPRDMAPINASVVKGYDAFREALLKDEGPYWENQLRKAGFIVLQAA